ncbi:hypothetical protein QPX35_07925, partial [Corynebacterium propinquum]|nr:hypothetical protein [Corynebacterium propinquum]
QSAFKKAKSNPRDTPSQTHILTLNPLVSLARPTVLRHLKELHSRGLVVWHKQSPNDPRATWSLE